MAQAIEKLHAGAPLNQIGLPDAVYLDRTPLRPLLGDNWMEGQILFIDHFENIIVNITHEQFEEQRKGRSFKIILREMK